MHYRRLLFVLLSLASGPGFAASLRPSFRLAHTASVECIAFSPNDRWIAVGQADGSIRLWETTIGRRGRLLWHSRSSEVRALAFSPDGRYLASGGSDHRIQLWSLPRGQQVGSLRGHSVQISALVFSSPTRLESASVDEVDEDTRGGEVIVWDVPSRKRLRTLSRGAGAWELALSPDRQTLAATTGGLYQPAALLLWDTSRFHRRRVALTPHDPSVEPEPYAVTFLDSRTIIIAAAYADDALTDLEKIDTKTGRVTHRYSWDASVIYHFSVCQNQEWLAIGTGSVADQKSAVSLLDMTTGKVARRLPSRSGSHSEALFSHNQAILATGDGERSVRLWRIFP